MYCWLGVQFYVLKGCHPSEQIHTMCLITLISLSDWHRMLCILRYNLAKMGNSLTTMRPLPQY